MTVSFAPPDVVMLIGIVLIVGSLITDRAQTHLRPDAPTIPHQHLIWAFTSGVMVLFAGTLGWLFTGELPSAVRVAVGLAALAAEAWALWLMRAELPPPLAALVRALARVDEPAPNPTPAEQVDDREQATRGDDV